MTATPAVPPQVPRHIAVIMDGNGRWARSRGLERSAGHVKGVDSVRTVTRAASDAGVKYLTLYAFSTENWHRPQTEVDALMHLMAIAIERETPDLIANNVRLHVIGDMDRLPDATRNCLQGCVDRTADRTGLNLILAISYSSRWEMVNAVRSIAARAAAGKLRPEDIDEQLISSHLTTAQFPDPDLLIRTGGEQRLSNFLLWQMAYSEIYVTDVYWPEFGREQLYDAIRWYNGRQRRFGLTGDQVSSAPPGPDDPQPR